MTLYQVTVAVPMHRGMVYVVQAPTPEEASALIAETFAPTIWKNCEVVSIDVVQPVVEGAGVIYKHTWSSW